MGKQATGGNIRIYVKRGIGPDYEREYEGCAEKGDVDLAPGDLTPITCESPAVWGKTEVIDVVVGEAGLPSMTINVLWSQARWIMEQAALCEMTLDLHIGYCDRPDNPDAWDSIFRLNRVLAQPAGINFSADQTTVVRVNANIAGRSFVPIYHLTLGTVDVGSYGGLDAVLAIAKEVCSGDCGAGFSLCDYVFVAVEGEYLDTAEVVYTADGGSTWAAMDTSPFAAGESISVIVGDVLADGSHRIIVFRGTTDGGNPAECAITTDWGATWNNVNIGAVNGQYITSAFRRGRKIWAGTDDGYIYYSADYGETWAAQTAGVTVTNDVAFIHMYSDSIGMAVCHSDEGVYTIDGGTTWTAIGDVVAGSEPDLLSVWMIDQWRAFCGTATGYVYYTEDQGTTWAQNVNLSAVGAIHRIKFWDENIGYLLAGETVYRTIDAGNSWAAETTPDAAILRDLSLCSANRFWAVGQNSSDEDVAIYGQPEAETPIF